jgi:hypothetical protein
MSDNQFAEALLVSRLKRAEDLLKKDPDLYNEYQRQNESECKTCCWCFFVCLVIILFIFCAL